MKKTKVKKEPVEQKEPRRGRRKEVDAQAPKAGGSRKLLEMASSLPAGEAKVFITTTMAMDRLDERLKELNKERRGLRATLKGMKIDLWSYDLMRKFRKMAAEDAKARKISLALYEQQMSLDLSAEQKATLAEMDKKREQAKNALYEAHGGAAGKEVGSSTQQPVAVEPGSIDETGPTPPKVPLINTNFDEGTKVALTH